VNADLRAAADAVAASLTSPTSNVNGYPQAFNRGAVGIALLHIERAAQGLAGWDVAHAWLTAATSDGVGTGQDATLTLGAPAIAFALHGAACQGRYSYAEAALDRAVATVVQQRLEQAHARIDRGNRPSQSEFDLFNGLTGFGAHLLRRDPRGSLLPSVLAYLVRLTEPLKDDDNLPGWWTDDPVTRSQYVISEGYKGHSNHGMAHGITGCLALLALSQRRGISVPGQTGALHRICDWLDTWQQRGPHGPWWPQALTIDELRSGTPSQTGPGRPSWCYGTPGIARAQQLAGQALGDSLRQQLAEQALVECLTDRRQVSLIKDVGLCHGIAGLFQTAWRMIADSRDPHLASQLPRLSGLLLAAPPSDDFGALDGMAGLALAQMTSAIDAVATNWDAFFLLN